MITLVVMIIFRKRCRKDSKQSRNRDIPRNLGNQDIPGIKLSAKHKTIGGWLYPGTYSAADWDPKNFTNLDYINIGSVYLKSPTEIVETNLTKNGDISKLLDSINSQNIDILISFDIQQDPIPGTTIRKQDAWNEIFKSVDNVPTVVDSIVSMLDRYRASGVNFDWEPSEKHGKTITDNITLLFKKLKNRVLKYTDRPPLISIDAVPNTRNDYDLKAINPFIDYFEVMSYFSLNFPYDYDNYYSDISREKIILGMGLSSYSFSNVNLGTDVDCPASTIVSNDWGAYCGPDGKQPCKTDGAFPSWNESWKDGPPTQYKYDFYLQKIRNNECKYIYSQNTFGPEKTTHLSYLYFDKNNSILPFNGFDRIKLYAETVLNNGYGGIFTWITSGDSLDGIFTRKIYEYLTIYPYYNCGNNGGYSNNKLIDKKSSIVINDKRICYPNASPIDAQFGSISYISSQCFAKNKKKIFIMEQ